MAKMISSVCSSKFRTKTQHTAVVLAIVRYHEHDLPFHDIVVYQSATYARDVLVALHLFELATQKPLGSCVRHRSVTKSHGYGW